jgi:hypothetical protein
MKRRSFPSWLLALASASACHAPPAPELRLDANEPPAGFPAPLHLLHGFDVGEHDGAWRPGDSVLYGLRLSRDGDVRHWLLRLELTEAEARADDGAELSPIEWSIRINGELQQFSSRQCRVIATVMDEYGAVLGRTEPTLPRDFLERGLADACRLVQSRSMRGRRLGRLDHIDVRPLAEATVSAVALLQIVQHDDVLSPLLWEVIEPPSLWSVVSHLGARIVLRPRFHALVDMLSPVPELKVPAWRLPLALNVNDDPALLIELFVADPTPPFALCGGVLGATARHPSKPGLEFSLLLLSGRRGAP